MTNREFFAKTWKSEQPKFVKVLNALPNDRLDYTPHERSTNAHYLASQLVVEARALAEIAKHGEVKWENPSKELDAPGMAAAFEQHATALHDAVASMTDAEWEDGPSKMTMDGGGAWETTKKEMFWGFLFDMIHHRGQLTTYIRPMGGKVPAIYGPSADEK